MKIKEVSQLTGLPESTIRFYEDEGLISPEKEYINGRYYRNYSESDVHLLQTIGILRKARFSMEEIRSMRSEPESIQTICTQCQLRLQEEAEALREISSVLSALNAASIDSMFSLADALSEKAKNVELPARDIQVSFARFDAEQWDDPPATEPGEELISETNEKINRIMGSQPESYVYSTGFYSSSPSKRMAMDEFSTARNMSVESGYPAYMANIKEYKLWAKILRIVCGAAIALLCVSLMFSAFFEYGDVSRTLVKHISDFIVLHWYLFAMIPTALCALATIFGQKK